MIKRIKEMLINFFGKEKLTKGEYLLIFLSLITLVCLVAVNASIYSSKAKGEGFPKEISEQTTKPVNINTASFEELYAVPGITEQMAYDIIAFRMTYCFEKPIEILNVEGITNSDYKIMRDYICVE